MSTSKTNTNTSKYDLYSKSKAKSLISDNTAYQQKQEYVSRNKIILKSERFTKNAYSSHNFSDLIDLLNKLAGNMTPPPLELLLDIDRDQLATVQNDIMECHTSITNVLVQLFSKLCEISENSNINDLEIAQAKCKLEEQIIIYNLYHPFDIKRENVSLLKLRVFMRWFLPSVKKTGAPSLLKIAPNLGSAPLEQNTISKDTPTDKFPFEQSVIDTTALNIMEVVNKVDQKFTQGISVQFKIIDKMKKFMPPISDMTVYMNRLESSVAKQLLSHYKFANILPPIIFTEHKLCDWVFEDSYAGGPIQKIETYLPGISCTLTKKTAKTTAEELLDESSVQDNKTDEALKTLDNELDNIVTITDKSSSEVNAYIDKSNTSELNVYADVYADLTTKALNAGGSGGIDAEVTNSEDSGTDSKFSTALEAAVTNMAKARSNQIEKANRSRQENKLKRSKSSIETTDESADTTKFNQPNRHSQLNVITRDLKEKSITITSVTGVELFFSNGIFTKRIDIANLDQDLSEFLDAEGVKRVKTIFLKALNVYDYRNRAIDLRDKTCPYLRVNINSYVRLLKSALQGDKVTNREDRQTEELEEEDGEDDESAFDDAQKNIFDAIDQYYIEKNIVGVIINVKDEVTEVNSPLINIEAGTPALNLIECRTQEQVLEEKDNELAKGERHIQALDLMLEHCKNLVTSGSPEVATDALQRLFTSANDLFDKSVLLHQTGSAQQNNGKK